MKSALWLALALGLPACASLSPNGERVLRVENPAIVKDCKNVGQVSSHPPYGLPDDWEKQARNETATLGGDTVLAESPGLKPGNVHGTAYLCHPAK